MPPAVPQQSSTLRRLQQQQQQAGRWKQLPQHLEAGSLGLRGLGGVMRTGCLQEAIILRSTADAVVPALQAAVQT
jgi:hypothetical protein